MALDPAALELYVYLPHRDLTLRDAAPCRADPPAVGRVAEQYTHRRASRYDGETSSALVARCSGILIYALDAYGLTYEEVCGVAHREVADILAQITPDNRMTEPTRHLKLREALGRASETAQLVKLAEITSFARKVHAELLPDDYLRHAAPLKFVVDRHLQLLLALSRLVGSGTMGAAVEAAQESLGRIVHGIDEARAARAAARAAATRP